MASNGFDSVEAKGVISCPHLQQLAAISRGEKLGDIKIQEMQIWPEPVTDPADNVPGPSLARLHDELRDELAAVDVTPAVCAGWAAELWGYSPDDAERVATGVVGIASRAKAAGQHLYCWSEL